MYSAWYDPFSTVVKVESAWWLLMTCVSGYLQQPWWLKDIRSALIWCNRPISQIPQCTSPISHNALFRTEMCTFLFWMMHCGISNIYIHIYIYERPYSQIPKFNCPISNNALFRTQMCTFLFWMMHWGISDRCIVGFINLVSWLPYGGSFLEISSVILNDIQLTELLRKWYGTVFGDPKHDEVDISDSSFNTEPADGLIPLNLITVWWCWSWHLKGSQEMVREFEILEHIILPCVHYLKYIYIRPLHCFPILSVVSRLNFSLTVYFYIEKNSMLYIILYINSSPSSAAYMLGWTGSTSAHIMVCRLVGANPLWEPILEYCWLDS